MEALGAGDSKTLQRAQAIARIANGEPVDAVSADTGLAKHHLIRWHEAVETHGLYEWLQQEARDDRQLKRSREGIAQILLGSLAERHFESLAVARIGDRGYRIEDQRVGRTDTDYRLIDPDGRFVAPRSTCTSPCRLR